jgi:hypothetical protein
MKKLVAFTILGLILMVVGYNMLTGKPAYVGPVMHTPITNTQYFCVFETKDAYYEYMQEGTQ